VSNFGTVTIINNQIYFSADGIPEGTIVQITYTVSDGNNGSATGTVTLIINNTWPEVVPDKYLMRPNTTININGSVDAVPLANDTDLNPTDILVYAQEVFSVQNGTFTTNTSIPSGFTYNPVSNFTGIDGGFYEIQDGSGNDGEGIFTIQVSDINWNKQLSSPDIPVLDFLDLTFDGINYALFNNDSIVKSPITGNGSYYAISGRMIISSTNKTTWQVEYATNNGNLSAIASGYTIQNPSINTHIAVGNLGTILINQTSTANYSHWLEVPTGLAIAFNNIHFDGSRFIAVGLNTVAFTNSGYIWSAVPTVNNVQYRDIIFANNLYVIVGDDGNIEVSTDSLSWQTQSSTTIEQLNAVAYGNNRYVAVGTSGTIVSSDNGTVWTSASISIATNFNQVLWHNNQFVAVGDSSTVFTSPDGVSWTSQTGIDTGNIRSVFSDNTDLLIGTNNGDLFSSTNATTFTNLQTNVDNLSAVAFDGSNTLVRVGNPGLITVSNNNAQSWTELTTLGSLNINEINYFNGQFIAVGDNGLIMSSTDGNNWTPQTSGSTENLNDAYWFSGLDVQGAPFSLWVVVGNNGTILTSTNGATWTREVASPSISDNLHAVTHDDDYFVIVGQSGRLLVRNNSALPGSTTWMDFFSNSSWGTLNDIFFTGSNCVIVGDAGRIVTGTAENGFSGGSISTTLDLFSVSGSNSKVITVGQDGVTFFSRDGGGSWQRTVQASEFTLFDIHYDAGTSVFYAVGERGTFLSGTDSF
jgi:hypothetical protein